ncbi:MAG: LysR family transcriptional regulator [marine benthic group bacterium]|nr:LysR family transcriptional regulator [Gemmatimonadota bacterium]
MQQLNYRQLEYFWAVGREGSITAAGRLLGVSQPAVSAQVRGLERTLGETLLRKSGRTLVLTDMGHLVFRYADEIFSLGRELTETVRGQPSERPLRLTVGMVQALPKMVAWHLVSAALRMDVPVRLVVREDQPDVLFGELALHAVDLVLSDAPLPRPLGIRAYDHALGDCGVSVLATADQAERYVEGFPASLEGAPFVLPTTNTMLRRSLDRWFEEQGIQPATVAEIEDSAVLKVFGQEGVGLIVVPTVIEKRICDQYGLTLIGRIESVRERFYAITAERRIVHPAVAAILQSARADLFQADSKPDS